MSLYFPPQTFWNWPGGQLDVLFLSHFQLPNYPPCFSGTSAHTSVSTLVSSDCITHYFPRLLSSRCFRSWCTVRLSNAKSVSLPPSTRLLFQICLFHIWNSLNILFVFYIASLLRHTFYTTRRQNLKYAIKWVFSDWYIHVTITKSDVELLYYPRKFSVPVPTESPLPAPAHMWGNSVWISITLD